jgi:serine protease Do
MRWIVGLGLALALAGPAAADGVTINMPEAAASPAPFPVGTKIRPVSLTRVAADIAPGTPWREADGPVYFFTPCIGKGEPDRWREGDNKVREITSFARLFRQELGTAGLQAAGDPTNLFEEQSGADLQVGALIKALQVKTCGTAKPLPNVDGSATMDVEWQVYSVSQAKVLARVETRGGAAIKSLPEGNSGPLVSAAFSDNVKRLATNEAFRRLVTSSPAAEPVANLSPIKFAPATGAAPVASAVKSVVVIYAGDGMGSGFVISPDGYILTNHHVAGDHGQVRVHWADGSDTVGDVVRADRRRDVALIRTNAKAPALAIRKDKAQLGEGVFVVGTPLDKQLQNTLTKGIVSANRLYEGLTFIQSDAAIDHGNSGGPLLDEKGQVLGLTQWTYSPDGVGHNLNFFIPIDDALKVLALEPAPPTLAPAPPPASATPRSRTGRRAASKGAAL